MPQADYFVDAARSDDTGAGTSWATAKKTIGAAMALVTTTGKTVAVAPGYYGGSTTQPGSSGSSGAWNHIIGDTREEYTDAGANTHGKGAGFIRIFSTGAAFRLNTNCDYWKISRLVCESTGGTPASSFEYGGIGLSAPIHGEINDVYSITLGTYAPFYVASYGASDITINRCIGFGTYGFYLQAFAQSSYPTSPQFKLQSCLGISNSSTGTCSGIGLIDYAGTKVYASVKNSTFANLAGSGKVIGGIGQILIKRSLFHGASIKDGNIGYPVGGNPTDSYGWTVSDPGSAYTWLTEKHPILLPQIWPVPGDLFADALSDYSGGLSGEEVYDLFGRAFAQTPGSIEYDGILFPYWGGARAGRGNMDVWSGAGSGGVIVIDD